MRRGLGVQWVEGEGGSLYVQGGWREEKRSFERRTEKKEFQRGSGVFTGDPIGSTPGIFKTPKPQNGHLR